MGHFSAQNYIIDIDDPCYVVLYVFFPFKACPEATAKKGNKNVSYGT